MRSKWISHKGKPILYQDFSGHYLVDSALVKEELIAVQKIVVEQPENSVLVISDFTNTQIGRGLMDMLIASSKITQSHIKKTAVLGVVGTKRILGDMLMRITGQKLTFFDDIERAKDWLVEN